jgi:hypothetical protein
MLKPLLRILIVVLVLGLIGLGVMYYMSNRTPSRYNPTALSDQQIAEASTRVDTQKMPRLWNLAAKAHSNAAAIHYSQARGQPIPPAATKPVDPVTVTFTQDEINSSFIKWSQQHKQAIEQYVTQPYVVIEEGQIILMGTVPELGRVVSMYLEPRITKDGQLRCDASSVYLGSLPLPDALFSKYRTKIEAALRTRIPEWQKRAKLDSGGAANPDARAVMLSRLVLQMLKREPGPALLFLPKNPEDWSNTFPVRLTEVTVQKGEVTITVEPTTPQERAALAEQLRQPAQRAAANPSPQT